MKKILIIEDNEEVRENTAEIIELSNYKAITAGNGKEGVEVALKELPDLIICDIMMPVLDGYGVFHLLSKHIETATIPFIFLTAKSEKADFRRGMEMGADDYLTKPFDGIDLLNAIEVRLKKSEQIKQQYSGADALTSFIKDVNNRGNLTLSTQDNEVFNYGKKQFIYKEGQRPRALYYVVSGKVKSYKSNDDGKELITNIYSAGDYFGYTPILQDEQYNESAQVLEDAGIMLIPRDDFMQLVSTDLATSKAFIKIITRNIVEKENALLNLAYNTLRKKVAYGIIQLLEKYKNDSNLYPQLNLSRENMAQTIGIATESLIRTLGDFKDEKLIEIQGGKLIILDENKLRSLPY